LLLGYIGLARDNRQNAEYGLTEFVDYKYFNVLGYYSHWYFFNSNSNLL